MSEWKTVKLGEILQIQPKSKIKAGDGSKVGIFPFYTCSNELTKKIDTADYEGPALVFGTGGNASVHYVDDKFSTSTDCLVYKTKSNTNLSLINKYLRTNIYLLENGFKGAGLKHISRDYISNIEIKLPDSTVQEKVVSQLDLLESNISKHKTILEKLDLLIKSRFIEMFGDPVSNPMGWETRELESIADIVSGITKGRKTKETELFEVPYMAVSNVKAGYIDWTTVKTIEATKAEIAIYQLKPNDVLMAEGGDPDKVGRGALITTVPKNCIHQNHVFRVRLNQLSPIYFSQYLQHEKSKRYFLSCAKQTTGIASINMTQLKGLPVLIPSEKKQDGFASFVQQIDKSKFAVQKSLEKAETLYKSLMQEYFG